MDIDPQAFQRAKPSDTPPSGPARWVLVRDGDVVTYPQPLPEGKGVIGDDAFPRVEDLPEALRSPTPIYLGASGDTGYFAGDVPADVDIEAPLSTVSLRSLSGNAGDLAWGIAGYASQMLYWRRTSKCCPVCGTETEGRAQDWGRVCPNCKHVGYPRVSPAVLILIHDGDRILLATKPGWNRYSILAGFVDSAETLEECVRRETYEEVRLTVEDLAYRGSQSWPFPHQLMVGFTARYAGGEIVVDKDELEHAAWFTPDTLPALPPGVSLSRRLIDAWLADRR